MVPNGWNTKPLADIVKEKISYGIVQAGPHVPDGIPYIKSSDVRGTINPDALQRTSQEIHFKYRRSSVHPGDIVFSLRGNIGESAIVPASLPEANLTQGTARISVSVEHSNLFHYYQLASEKILNRVNALSKGSTFKEISLEELRKVKVLCAPLPEQKKIAQILSTWDKAITTTEQLLANSQQQKKALMQQLLTGKKRLLDKHGVRFSGEWKWLRASELFKPVSKKNNSDSEELLAVTQDQGVLPRSLLERRVVMPDGSTNGYKLVVPGNFIISLRSFQGGLEYSGYRGLVSPAYTVLEPIKSIDDEFYKHYYKSYDFIGHLAVAVIGIRDGKQISYSDFSFLKLPYPSLEEQQKIAAVLSTADQEISALQQKLDALKQEKKALMQQLLTGKRRVVIE
ncbi:restriction endonuclease subunit S [Vibrio cholerae]|uniref:restriction endonuclease subunit S n=1 Tax=Vibrio cholerae TaxID=666 RepID=UPI001C6783B4|nr:restriction endonuclease subunit S [Vibrio cholerae]MBW5443936.1 restriction endonuclease subunit S [Vibrio cholerae]